MTILFAGDPHRNFSPIIRACLTHPPGHLVLLGDLDCPRPITEIFAGPFAAGWRVHWILGNHDCETEAAYDNLVMNQPDGDLGFRVIDLDGVRVAGLPGVFKPSVWYPRSDDGTNRVEPPRYQTREAFLAAQPKERWWRDGLPLWHRDTIFPDDFDRLAKQNFDVLVSHEAPSSHQHGFAVIDQLVASAGARLIVHGHHHDSYAATLPNGIAVRGLGLAEPWPYQAVSGVG
jgi:calcineurin-like phosphoesterase family protein